MTELKSKGRVKFLLLAHLIFVVKYRKKLLVTYGNEVKQKMIDISMKNNFDIDTIEVDKDHIHLLISYEPQVSITQIVSALKRETTYELWQKYESALRLQFWKEHTFWTPSYFVCSIGNASEETIRKYIEEQG